MDYFSGYYEIEIPKEITSKKIVNILERMFCRHKITYQITSDNGTLLKSKLFEAQISFTSKYYENWGCSTS